MVRHGIVLDSNERKLDELSAKSAFGGQEATLVLTDRRVHLRHNEFLGKRIQRTFDLRHVQSIDYGRAPNVGAWFGMIVFGMFAIGMLIAAAQPGQSGLFFGAAILVGLTVLCGLFLFHKTITVAAAGQEQRLPMWRTKQEAVNEFGRNVLRTKDSIHGPVPGLTLGANDHEARLSRLGDLLTKGLISKEEYAKRRAEVLATI